jgi:hypothetical protein
MTNKAALKSTVVQYPIEDDTLEKVLLDRGLIASDEYNPVENKKAVDLAKADLYVTLVTAATGSEGGFSFSLSDKQLLLKQAGVIYGQYGEVNPLKPTVTGLSIW